MAADQIKVIRLSHVVYQHPDLPRALSFLKDFGLTEAGREGTRVFLRGYGIDPYVYIAEQSPDSSRHFLGAAWVVESAKDLQQAALHPGASQIQDITGPGGGQIVTLKDPNGFAVGFVYGQTLNEAESYDKSLVSGEISGKPPNTALEKPRRGLFRRFQPGASPIHKLGHYGFSIPESKFQPTLEWYTSTMNLKPTDAVFEPRTEQNLTIFMHIDLGEQYTDHHVSEHILGVRNV